MLFVRGGLVAGVWDAGLLVFGIRPSLVRIAIELTGRPLKVRVTAH
jgi:hypothetical protein